MNSEAMQRKTKEMLERQAWREHSLEHWLDKVLPKIIDFASNKCQGRSRQARDELAHEFNLPGISFNFGTKEFASAYPRLSEKLLCHNDDNMVAQFSTVSEERRQFLRLRDMKVHIKEDILPTLQAMRDGHLDRTMSAHEVTQMLKEVGDILDAVKEVTPTRLALNQPDITHNQFAVDMRSLVKFAYVNEQQSKSERTFADNVHQHNRLQDQWKER